MEDKHRNYALKIGKLIQERRQKKRWTAAEFGEKIGYSESYISKIESGNSLATTRFLIEVAELFDIQLSTLLRG